MRAEAASTTNLLDDVARRFPGAHARLLRQRPAAWASGLRRALWSGDRTARARLWQTFYFAEAVVLLDELRRRDIRHVHVHFANVSADVARLVVHLGRIIDGPDAGWRWSMTMHGPTEFEAVEKVDLAAKVASADGVACISDFCRSQLMRLVAPSQWPKLHVVRMAVDPRRYVPPPGGRDTTGDRPLRILDVGRLVPEKGAPVLIDAVAELRDAGVEVEVRIVGGGELEDDLRDQIRARDLGDRVSLLGPIGQDDILEQYHWADVFVLPSFQEGLPVVIMEALATELPVVTTRIAAVEELVEDGRMGRVLPPGRGDLLAGALADLARDPDARARMGRTGRDAVLRSFTTDTTAGPMSDFLAGVGSRRS
ncbi:glycosyltransferase family 4 protein [Agilicoccus flavus]|uniref:glycosyltransferase family 4 protein n=1 Tax=Agilicoccus flavus TaxID=2775968 RepID=UPI001CF6DFE3|nr:glycosyltransferase family 4 protein [Agilicoccus flavus]